MPKPTTPAQQQKVYASAEYSANADMIRVLAIVFVVSIHLLNPIYARPDFFGGTIWWLSFLLNCLFRVSVPLFLMLSGYLLLDKSETFTATMRRLKTRILLPLVMWYIFIILFNIWASWMRAEPYSYLSILTNLGQSTGTHLYFLVGLGWCYFSMPFIRSFFNQHSARTQQLVTYVLLGSAMLATLAKYVLMSSINLTSTFIIGFMWIGYFMFGYIAKKYLSTVSRIKLLWVFCTAYLWTVVTGYYQLLLHHSGNNLFYSGFTSYADEFLSVGVVAMSLATFLLLINYRPLLYLSTNQIFRSRLQLVSGLSFGLYVVHVTVMDFYHKFVGINADNPLMPNLGTYIILSFFATFITSAVITIAIKKIPQTRWLLGE